MSKAPRRWTPEEDRILHRELVAAGEDGRPKSWTAIAACLPGRTNKDCRKRWCNHLVGGLRKGPWSGDEDERLTNAVQKHGQQWSLVSEAVRTRSGDQCAKRWNQALDPALDRSNWTQEEQRTLLKAVMEHGRSWKQIQEMYFPERATNNVKNRYMTLAKGDKVTVDQLLNQMSDTNYEDGYTHRSPSEDVQSFDMSSECFSSTSATSYSEESFEPSSAGANTLDSIPDTLDMDGVDYFNIDPFFMNYSKSANSGPDMPPMQQTSHSDSPQDSTTNYVFESHASTDADYMLDFSSTEITPQTLAQAFPIDKAARQKFVITIDEPSPEMVGDIMGVLVTTKAKFKSEMQHGG